MDILLWLAVPLAVTALAMVWAAWGGRPRNAARTDERAKQRLARAITDRRPRRPLLLATQRRERPTGVAVRPSRRRADGR